MRSWGSGGAVILLLAAVACAPEEEVAAPLVTAPPVMVVNVEARDVSDRIQATGQLIAKARATIAAQVNGQVTAVLAEEGDAVEAGQALLEIDPQRRELELINAQSQLAEARAQLGEAERESKRMQRLSKSAAASQARLDEAETRLALTRSRLAGAQARFGLARRALEDSTVRAPFAGLVDRRMVSFGEYLSTGLPIFEVVALDPIEVEFDLAEVDSARVKVGHEVGLTVAPYPDEIFGATVTVVSPTIDPATRTLRVKAELANPGNRLRPGLFARADLGVNERSAVVMVPEDALVMRADGTVVYRLVEDEGKKRVELVGVRTGVFRNGWVEVMGGVDAEDRVVVRGQAGLVDGSVVSLRTRDGRLLGVSESGQSGETAAARPAEGGGS
jgi:membrane fusion protein (multidrug efflux system)